ncbi:MAG: S-layer protein [uncultured Truepera sp.]|uniref:S-layer protein n=1 Tax=uncultured Truepera sp. TaxID=543023 RepID=A0A6J4VUF1_9DEIN|nr:MAG: S-layer protein [uncultured Truepera sp.]
MVTRLIRPRLLLSAAALGAALFIGYATAQDAPFYDLPETHWAYDSVRELAELGVVTGYPDGRFDGTRATTRYEVAVVAARLLDYVDEVVGVAGERPQLTTAAADLGDAPLEQRVRALESALEGAASLVYARRLEARVITLEAALDVQDTAQGDTSLPSATEPEDDAVALPQAAAEVAAATPIALAAGQLTEIRFSSRPDYAFFVGISPGVVSTAGDVYLSVQAGYDALIGPVGPAARLTFNGGNRELRVTLDALAKADLLVDELKLYGGLGFGTTVRPDGGSLLLEAPFGGEYFITPRVSLFLQLTTSYGFIPISNVDAELSTGLNLHF